MRLVLLDFDKSAVREFPLPPLPLLPQQTFTIGSNIDANIRVRVKGVYSNHCVLTVSKRTGEVLATITTPSSGCNNMNNDDGTNNHTPADQQHSTRALYHGDELMVGPLLFQFLSDCLPRSPIPTTATTIPPPPQQHNDQEENTNVRVEQWDAETEPRRMIYNDINSGNNLPDDVAPSAMEEQHGEVVCSYGNDGEGQGEYELGCDINDHQYSSPPVNDDYAMYMSLRFDFDAIVDDDDDDDEAAGEEEREVAGDSDGAFLDAVEVEVEHEQ